MGLLGLCVAVCISSDCAVGVGLECGCWCLDCMPGSASPGCWTRGMVSLVRVLGPHSRCQQWTAGSGLAVLCVLVGCYPWCQYSCLAGVFGPFRVILILGPHDPECGSGQVQRLFWGWCSCLVGFVCFGCWVRCFGCFGPNVLGRNVLVFGISAVLEIGLLGMRAEFDYSCTTERDYVSPALLRLPYKTRPSS